MSNKKQRLKVIKQSSTGLNLTFIDTKTNKRLTRDKVVKQINAGGYPDYITYKFNNKDIVRSKPDKNKKNNLN
ncbi:MAG: hypothetical protein PQJ49_10965 [Sphaerochaetaceae bacterium]|nr:hypothetical protein [Sphaerochaetaceae bacterium]